MSRLRRTLGKLLAHSDSTFRAWGVRAAGDLGRAIQESDGSVDHGKLTADAIEKIKALAADPSPDVQVQVAIAAKKIEGIDALPLLVAVAAKCGEDKIIPNIVWQNLRLMQRIARVNGKDVLPVDFHACNAYDNGLAAAGLLHCPALFVLGAADMMTPRKSAQALVDAIPGDKQVIVLPDTGHSLMAEHPDGVRRALEQFAR